MKLSIDAKIVWQNQAIFFVVAHIHNKDLKFGVKNKFKT